MSDTEELLKAFAFAIYGEMPILGEVKGFPYYQDDEGSMYFIPEDHKEIEWIIEYVARDRVEHYLETARAELTYTFLANYLERHFDDLVDEVRREMAYKLVDYPANYLREKLLIRIFTVPDKEFKKMLEAIDKQSGIKVLEII